MYEFSLHLLFFLNIQNNEKDHKKFSLKFRSIWRRKRKNSTSPLNWMWFLLQNAQNFVIRNVLYYDGS